MNVSAIRRALAGAIDVPEDVKALMGPTRYDTSFREDPDEINFVLRILVGEPNASSEDRIDELVALVPKYIAADRSLGGVVGDTAVVDCSGHRLLPTGAGAPPILGVEWTVKVQA